MSDLNSDIGPPGSNKENDDAVMFDINEFAGSERNSENLDIPMIPQEADTGGHIASAIKDDSVSLHQTVNKLYKLLIN